MASIVAFTEHLGSQAAAKAFTLTSALWFAFATSFGMIAAGYLIAPDFMANIEFIQFGRVPTDPCQPGAVRLCHPRFAGRGPVLHAPAAADPIVQPAVGA
jgi:hypothetical protein